MTTTSSSSPITTNQQIDSTPQFQQEQQRETQLTLYQSSNINEYRINLIQAIQHANMNEITTFHSHKSKQFQKYILTPFIDEDGTSITSLSMIAAKTNQYQILCTLLKLEQKVFNEIPMLTPFHQYKLFFAALLSDNPIIIQHIFTLIKSHRQLKHIFPRKYYHKRYSSIQWKYYIITKDCIEDPLCYTCENGKVESFRYLINAGLQWSYFSTLHSTKCIQSVIKGDNMQLWYLYTNYFKVDVVKSQINEFESQYGPILLHIAHYGTINSFQYILQYFGKTYNDCLERTPSCNNILHYAILSNNVKMVEYLLEIPGVEDLLYQTNNNGIYPFSLGCSSGTIKTIEYLYTKYPHLIHQVSDGNTIVHYTIVSEDINMVRYIMGLDGMIDLIEVEDAHGQTPLVLAYYHSTVEIVQYLIEELHVNYIQLSQGRNILHYVPKNHSMLQYILSLPNSHELLNQIDHGNETPLTYAAQICNYQCIQLLIEHGANYLYQDPIDETNILHYIVAYGDEDLYDDIYAYYEHTLQTDPIKLKIIKYIIELDNGQQLLLQNNQFGRSPLSFICSRRSWVLVRAILGEYYISPLLQFSNENQIYNIERHFHTNNNNSNNNTNDFYNNLLHYVVRNDFFGLEMVESILDYCSRGVKKQLITQYNQQFLNVFLLSIMYDKEDLFQYLLWSHGNDIISYDSKYHRNLLHNAVLSVEFDAFDLTKLLYILAINLDDNNNDDITCLISDQINSFNQVDVYGFTPLFYACYYNDFDKMRISLAHGFTPNPHCTSTTQPIINTNTIQRNIIHCAIHSQNTDLYQLVLSLDGIDYLIYDSTLLHDAAKGRGDNEDILISIIEKYGIEELINE